MKTTIRHLLTATALLASTGGAVGGARADGPMEYGYDAPDPSQGNPYPEADQAYQPPPEGVCFDDNSQTYDCSKDEDYSQYNQLDDGYDQTAYQDFQAELAPHGDWVDDPQYGQVWTPSAAEVGADFTPYYSGGRWTLSDYGWTWVSNHSWGWAPFHYGRWMQLGHRGWSWIPGRVWGPAWVHWRTGGGYVGWAPLPPRGVRINPPMFGVRGHSWNFVAADQLTAPRLYRVAPSMMPNIYGRTTIANDYRRIGSTRIIVGPPSSRAADAARRADAAARARDGDAALAGGGAAGDAAAAADVLRAVRAERAGLRRRWLLGSGFAATAVWGTWSASRLPAPGLPVAGPGIPALWLPGFGSWAAVPTPGKSRDGAIPAPRKSRNGAIPAPGKSRDGTISAPRKSRHAWKSWNGAVSPSWKSRNAGHAGHRAIPAPRKSWYAGNAWNWAVPAPRKSRHAWDRAVPASW